MDLLNSALLSRNDAELHLSKARIEEENGDLKISQGHYIVAYEFAKDSVNKLRHTNLEPDRALSYYLAAMLAFRLGELVEAIGFIKEGLNGNISKKFQDSFIELFKKVKTRAMVYLF